MKNHIEGGKEQWNLLWDLLDKKYPDKDKTYKRNILKSKWIYKINEFKDKLKQGEIKLVKDY